MRVGDCMNKKLERKDYKVETWRDAGTSQCTFACFCHMRRIPVFQEAFLRSLYYRIGTWFGLGAVRPARQSQTNTPPSTNTFLQFSRHSDDECSSACFVPGSVWHSIRSFPMPEVEVPLWQAIPWSCPTTRRQKDATSSMSNFSQVSLCSRISAHKCKLHWAG